jgi:hypothetical protein
VNFKQGGRAQYSTTALQDKRAARRAFSRTPAIINNLNNNGNRDYTASDINSLSRFVIN